MLHARLHFFKIGILGLILGVSAAPAHSVRAQEASSFVMKLRA